MYLLFDQALELKEVKQSWNRFEQLGVEVFINEYFADEYGITNAVEFFGLTYFSSGYLGDYPAFFVTSREGNDFEIEDGIVIKCFIMNQNETLIAVGEDQDEKEYYYNVIN